MNLNEKMVELGRKVGCEVEEGIFSQKGESRYIVFVYEDERPDTRADNGVAADIAYLQISYYTPKEYDYMNDKHIMRDYLEEQGFSVTSIRSWIEDAITGYQRIRHTVFEVNYLESRRK